MVQKDTVEKNMFFGAEPILFEFAKRLRNNETFAERVLWEELRLNKLMGLRFRRQHPIKYFIADFYCHKAKLVIEVDGGIHNVLEQYEYDLNRDNELKELGITVLRFTNHEVCNDMDYVLSKIKETIKKSPLGDLGV